MKVKFVIFGLPRTIGRKNTEMSNTRHVPRHALVSIGLFQSALALECECTYLSLPNSAETESTVSHLVPL